jgi:hypothetical protein
MIEDYTLVVREKISKKPDGDRATTTKDCSVFEVWIRDHGDSEVLLASFDQYDNWHSSIKDHGRTSQEAIVYADRLADFFGCQSYAWEKFRWQPPVVPPAEWVRIS